MKLTVPFAAGLLLAVCAWLPTRAQAPAGPLPPKPGAPVQKAPQAPPIRVRVELVTTPITVRDASGELVMDLNARDFHVYDNGVEQKIEHFDIGGDPLSVVIVVETSSRIQALLPEIRKTGILFTQTVLGQTGDAAILGYNDAIDKLLPFTSNHDQVERAFSRLQNGTSGARLYDALSEAVGMLRDRPPTRRRIIIALAEAVDTGSETKLGQVLREAQLANITIYSVGLSSTAAELRAPPKQAGPSPVSPPGTFPMPSAPGTVQTPTTEQQRYGNVDLLALAVWLVQHATAVVRDHPLELATAATGGLYQSTFRDRSIETAIDRIGGELNAQYTVSYRPTGTDPSGYHEIKVLVARPGLKVRSRPGYYLSPPAS